MHRLPNDSSVVRFRVTALLLLLKWLFIPGSFFVLIYALLTHYRDSTWVMASMGGLLVALFLALVQWIMAAKCRCPLCLGKPLCHSAAVKNRHARRLFGSYRIRVAATIFFRGYFRCPYCGEPTEMQARTRHESSRRRRRSPAHETEDVG